MERLNVVNFSSILNKQIIDEDNVVIGTLKDIYFTDKDGNYPKAIGYKVNKNGDTYNYEFKEINFYEDNRGNVSIEIRDARVIMANSYSFKVATDIIDKEVKDINGEKSFKIYDVRLALFDDVLRIIALDKSKAGLARRNGLSRMYKFFNKNANKKAQAPLILWDDISSIELKKNGNLAVNVPYHDLSTLHPADLAEILEEVDTKYSKKVFESLDEEYAADILEEFEEAEVQAEIISSMNVDKAQEVLELMANEEIAEILEELDEEKKDEIMSNLEQDDADDVNELMSYEDEEIGSIMSKDYLSFPHDITVKEVIDTIREMEDDFDFDEMYYVFVTDLNGTLEGYVPFGELVRHKNEEVLQDIMDTHLEDVEANEHAETAVDLAIKYELLQIPVVDEDDVLIGVVNIHDVIDEFLAPLWKKKNKKD